MKLNLRAIAKKDPGQALHIKRKIRIRKIVNGTKDRPRLSVFKSAKHIYVQAIDDVTATTLTSVCTLEPSVIAKIKESTKSEAAKIVGTVLGEKLKAVNISAAVFDRNGFRYTGRIAALAEGVRSTGLLL